VTLYDRSVTELMIEAAAQAEYPTTPGDFVAWFPEHYPRVKASTVKLHVKGLTANDRNRHHFHSLAEREPLFTKNPDGSLSPFESPAVDEIDVDEAEDDAENAAAPRLEFALEAFLEDFLLSNWEGIDWGRPLELWWNLGMGSRRALTAKRSASRSWRATTRPSATIVISRAPTRASTLRPGEALALTWDRVGERTIAVTGASSMGRLKGTKTGAERTVRLLQPLAQDLADWRLARGRPDPGGIVFPGDSLDGTLTEGQWDRWTQGTFRAAKVTAGLPTARAYDLRHSFVSLPIHEGQSILEVARQAGHSPQTCLRDYGHLFDEFDPAKREPAEAVIGAARASSYLSHTFRQKRSGAKPLVERKIPRAGSPTAGTSASCPPRTGAPFQAEPSGAARAPSRATCRPSPARTGSTRRA
jgi:integrase